MLYDGHFIWIMLFVIIARVAIAVASDSEKRNEEGTLLIADLPGYYDYDDEPMTPDYMPAPHEAGDHFDLNQKEI